MELYMEQVRYRTYHFEIMVEMILSINKVDWDYLSKNLCAKFCLNRLECASSVDILRFFRFSATIRIIYRIDHLLFPCHLILQLIRSLLCTYIYFLVWYVHFYWKLSEQKVGV